MQMCVMELKERPGKPLFHLEHYIEGKYIKYNSNSGFVHDDNMRLTPQVWPLERKVPLGRGFSPLEALKPHGTSQRISHASSVSHPEVSTKLQDSFLCLFL